MKIAIIGSGKAPELTEKIIESLEHNEVCIVETKRNNLTDSEPYLIKALPKFPEPWIDPNAEVFNYQKHQQTCAKNRKKRKNKKR